MALTQILSSLGFKQCAGETKISSYNDILKGLFLYIGDVECLGRSVTSQYGVGLFLQHPDTTGEVYNVSSIMDLESVKCSIVYIACRCK